MSIQWILGPRHDNLQGVVERVVKLRGTGTDTDAPVVEAVHEDVEVGAPMTFQHIAASVPEEYRRAYLDGLAGVGTSRDRPAP